MFLKTYAIDAIWRVAWDVELTEECEGWSYTLTEAEQESVGHGFDLLAELGPALSRQYAETLKGSRNPDLTRGEMSPESQTRLVARLQETFASMPLDKLRKARSLTQTAVADRLQVDQGSVSKLEGRTDMYLSTLREYVEALGGTLELRADFPDGSINIDLHAS